MALFGSPETVRLQLSAASESAAAFECPEESFRPESGGASWLRSTPISETHHFGVGGHIQDLHDASGLAPCATPR